MFVNETKSYYVMYNPVESSKNAAKKKEFFEKAMEHLGAEKVSVCNSVWAINNVMYSSSNDVADIIGSEMIRFASQDNATKDNKNDFDLKKGEDNLLISEYNKDNTMSL